MSGRALSVVVARTRLAQWPTPHEILAMLDESGADQGETRDIVARYAAALGASAPGATGEASVLDTLRSFRLGAEP